MSRERINRASARIRVGVCLVLLSGCGVFSGGGRWGRKGPAQPPGSEAPPVARAGEDHTAAVTPPLILSVEPVSETAAGSRATAANLLDLVAASEIERSIEVRVGLESDLETVSFLAPLGGLEVRSDAVAHQVAEGVRVSARPATAGSASSTLRVQVAALRDPRQAAGLAERQRRRTGLPSDAIFDAATGFYRVRVGRFADRSSADRLRRELAGHGAPDAWIAVESGTVSEPQILLEAGDWKARLATREVALESLAGQPLAWRGNQFRGHLVLFVNDRGSFNLINQVDLEDYLRGVVTREMGPGVYPWPEALRAQAVAARTYTLRHLGEFAAEGFDICATPRCQVYRGITDEHRMSAEAVVATRGLILIDGQRPADTLYSASCGGHTEDVGRVFPTLDAPYLQGVPCTEGGSTTLGGAALDPLVQVAAALASWTPPLAPSTLAARCERLARRRGLGESSASLVALEPSAVRTYLAHRFDAVLDPRLFEPRPDSAQPPWMTTKDTWLDRELRHLEAPLSAAGADRLIVALATALDLTSSSRGLFHSVRAGRLRFREGSQLVTARLPPGFALASGESLTSAVPRDQLNLAPGDPVVVWRVAGDVVAVLATPSVPPSAKRVPLHGPWSRFKSLAELRRRVALEYPDFELGGLEVLERGVSSRVARLRLTSTDSSAEVVEGLAIRWLLDIPDTRFDATPGVVDGASGWVFRGRGWGHGVGLCQTGAALMARAGRSFEEILGHYYSGLELAVARQIERRSTWKGTAVSPPTQVESGESIDSGGAEGS